MFILQKDQVQMCQFQLTDEEKSYLGFIYLDRLFMRGESSTTDQLKIAVKQTQYLLESGKFAVILRNDDSYSIWALAPETAEVITDCNAFFLRETRLVIPYSLFIINY